MLLLQRSIEGYALRLTYTIIIRPGQAIEHRFSLSPVPAPPRRPRKSWPLDQFISREGRLTLEEAFTVAGVQVLSGAAATILDSRGLRVYNNISISPLPLLAFIIVHFGLCLKFDVKLNRRFSPVHQSWL